MVYGALTPYLSILVRGLGYSPFWVGILLGVFEGAGVAGPFVFGYLTDRTGNYRMALITATVLPVLAVVPLIVFIHPLISMVMLALMAFGFRSTTSLLDAVTTIQIGKTGDYGKIRVTGSLSFILFTLFLQWTPFFKPHSAGTISFWIGLSSVAAIIPIMLLPGASTLVETGAALKTFGRNPGFHRNSGRVLSPAPGSGRLPLMSAFFIGGFSIIFLCRLAMAAVYTYFPLYLTEVLRWDAVGLMFALATAAEVPCMFLSGRLIRRFGPLPLLALSAAGISVRLLVWALFPYKACIIAAQMLHSLCFGIYHPAAVNFITVTFPPEKRGTGMSVYLALGSGLPALMGNMLGGALVENTGYRGLFALYAGFTGIALFVYGLVTLGSRTKQ